MNKRSIKNTQRDVEPTRIPGREALAVWWLFNKEDTGSREVAVAIAEFSPGATLQLHRHPNAEEVTYALRGTGVHFHEGGEETVQEQGEAVFIGRGEWHGFRNDTDEPVVIMGIYGGVGSDVEAGFEEHPDNADSSTTS